MLDKYRISLCAGDSEILSAEIRGTADKDSRVRFISTDDGLVISDYSFDENTGKSSVKITAVKNAEGSIVAISETGHATAACAVKAGEVLEESEMLNRAVGGTVVSDASSPDGEGHANAFDNSSSTKWLILNSNSAEITYTFADNARYYITRYAVVSGNDDPDRDPKAWSFYGSNDKENWDLLDQRSDEVFYGRKLKRIFEFEADCAYSSYKLVISENGGGTHTQLSEIQLFECGEYPSWGMGPFIKQDESNPILEANTDKFHCPVRNQEIMWTDLSLYNPTAIIKDDAIQLLYRAQDNTDKKTSRIGLATSTDGYNFDRMDAPVLYPDNTYNQYEWGGGCEDPRVIEGPDGKYYIYYTGYDGSIARLMVASSSDLINWEKHGLAFADAYDGKYRDTWSKSGSVITEITGGKQIAKKIDGKFWMYWGESDFFMATSDDLIHWTPMEDEDGKLVSVMKPRKGMYDSYLVEPGPAAIYTDEGIYMLYNCANDNPSGSGDPMLANRAYCPGQVMFDPSDPTKLIHRSKSYLMYPEKDYELDGLVGNVCFIEGLVYYHDIWYVYYGTADSRLAVAVWDPSQNTTDKPVRMDSSKLTVNAGKDSVISAVSDTGKEIEFISTDPKIIISDVTFDKDTGRTTAKVSAEKAGQGIIVALDSDGLAYDTCEVTVTSAFYIDDVSFVSGDAEISAVAPGSISMQMKLGGYYDATADFRPVIALYKNGVLVDWQMSEYSGLSLKEGETALITTDSITVPDDADMTGYEVVGFLWDTNCNPLTDAIVLDRWSIPNLALGKTAVSSSDEKEEVSAGKATDGNPETRWASKSEDNQWLTVDLGEVTDINRVVISWESAYATDYRIEVSDNTDNDSDFKTVASVTGSSGGKAVLDFDLTKARYVRLYCEKRSTGWGNSVWEFEVYNTNMRNDSGLPFEPAEDTSRKIEVTETNTPAVSSTMSVIGFKPGADIPENAADYLDVKNEDICFIGQVITDETGAYKLQFALDSQTEGFCILKFVSENAVFEKRVYAGAVIKGDADNNGVVNVSDILMMKNLIMSGEWNAEYLARCDIDGNNTINVSDILAVKNIIMSA